MWRETTNRAKYEELSAADKARYEEEKGQIRKINLSKRSNNSAKDNKESGETFFKRKPSAYTLFCKEFRANVVDEAGNRLPLGETTKRLASMWKSCDAKTKAKFEKLALEEKERVNRNRMLL
jgi:hypothetical protein